MMTFLFSFCSSRPDREQLYCASSVEDSVTCDVGRALITVLFLRVSYVLSEVDDMPKQVNVFRGCCVWTPDNDAVTLIEDCTKLRTWHEVNMRTRHFDHSTLFVCSFCQGAYSS